MSKVKADTGEITGTGVVRGPDGTVKAEFTFTGSGTEAQFQKLKEEEDHGNNPLSNDS